jgi:hypothetical protein
MFRLSYSAIIRPLIISDNNNLVASHRMVVLHTLQFVCFVIYVDLKIIKQYVRKIFKDKIYAKYKM